MLKRLFIAALGLVWLVLAVGCARGSPETLQPTITAVSVPQGTPGLGQVPQTSANPMGEPPATSGTAALPRADAPSATIARGLDAACLVGLWEAVDLPAAMAESFRQTTTGLALQSVEGRVLYRFAPDGTLTIEFDRLTATLSGTLDNRPVTAQQVLSGQATALYHVLVEEEELVLSSFGGEGILFSLDINNQRLAEGNLPAWRAFTNTLSDGSALTPGPLMEQARAEATCEGDSLILQTIDPQVGPEVLLKRLE